MTHPSSDRGLARGAASTPHVTQDIGITAGQFDQALASRHGPFLRWDYLLPGESLTILNPNGTVKEEYVGDPNYAHTIAGSPFDTNFFRIDGPTATAPVIGIVPIDALGAFTFDSATAPAPDATQLVTLESTGGGVLTARVAFK